jgi:hypothetical protein
MHLFFIFVLEFLLLHFESRFSFSLILVYVEIQDEGFLVRQTLVSGYIMNRVQFCLLAVVNIIKNLFLPSSIPPSRG